MKCPECSFQMQHKTWDEVITHQGKSVTVHAVSGNRCPECGEGVFDEESYDRVVATSDGLIRALRKSNPPIKPEGATAK